MTARILVVEDSPSMRGFLRDTLDLDGYEVSEAADGLEALSLLEGLTPDLIISDINMPRLDGFGLLREVRRLPTLRFTPVLVLTTEGGADMKERGRAAGATGWIVKPVDPEQLRRVVTQVLGARARV
jgi:two-component system, chemotaxis family, chemotaxis protein CheY